jgi:hypothetical protein
VQERKELQRQGMSIQAISKLTGWDRKTIRKYIAGGGDGALGCRVVQFAVAGGQPTYPYVHQRVNGTTPFART